MHRERSTVAEETDIGIFECTVECRVGSSVGFDRVYTLLSKSYQFACLSDQHVSVTDWAQLSVSPFAPLCVGVVGYHVWGMSLVYTAPHHHVG